MSDARFSDGLRYRIEIPSVEGPAALRAVLAEAEARSVPVRRVSQGSGVMMLTDAEITELAALGAEHGVEGVAFLGPRGAWDIGGQSSATASVGGVARGQAGIDWCIAEVRRAVRLGIRSVLVADVGVLATLGRMKHDGQLPTTLVLKTSVLLPCANPATARTLEGSARRRSTSRPISSRRRWPNCAQPAPSPSTCTSGPDDQGGFVPSTRYRPRSRRLARLPQARPPQRAGHLPHRSAPGGLRDQARSRAGAPRRALLLQLLREQAPELLEERGAERPPDLGIPEP